MSRLRWALVVASCSVIAHCAAARAEGLTLVQAVGCVGLTVSELDRSVVFYSGGVVRLPDRGLGYGRAVLARDPDGHVLQLAAE